MKKPANDLRVNSTPADRGLWTLLSDSIPLPFPGLYGECRIVFNMDRVLELRTTYDTVFGAYLAEQAALDQRRTALDPDATDYQAAIDAIKTETEDLVERQALATIAYTIVRVEGPEGVELPDPHDPNSFKIWHPYVRHWLATAALPLVRESMQSPLRGARSGRTTR